MALLVYGPSNASTDQAGISHWTDTKVVVSLAAAVVLLLSFARPLMLTGAAVTTGGMYWFSHISVHTTHLSGLLGPMLVTAAGLGLLFVPLSLVALTRVRDEASASAARTSPTRTRPPRGSRLALRPHRSQAVRDCSGGRRIGRRVGKQRLQVRLQQVARRRRPCLTDSWITADG